MSATVGPGPRVGVVVQHSGHGVLGFVLAHVCLALEVVVVWNVQPGEKKNTQVK